MKFLSFHLGSHDSNASISVDGKIQYAKFERTSGRKHGGAELDWLRHMCNIVWGETSFDGIADCCLNPLISGFCKINQCFVKRDCRDILSQYGIEARETFRLDHHFSHILSAFPLISMDSVDYGIAIDGNGHHDKTKQIVSHIGRNTSKIISWTRAPQFPIFLQEIGRFMNIKGSRHDFAGKIMAAQSYGEIDYDYVDSIPRDLDNAFRLIDEYPFRGNIPVKGYRIDHMNHSASEQELTFFNFDQQSFRDYLRSTHHILNMHNLNFFKQNFKPTDTILYLRQRCAKCCVQPNPIRSFS